MMKMQLHVCFKYMVHQSRVKIITNLLHFSKTSLYMLIDQRHFTRTVLKMLKTRAVSPMKI